MTPGSEYKADLRAAYDADAERRDAMTPAPWRTAIVDDFLARARSEGATSVLELGCGTGQLARHAVDAGFALTAIDLSPGNVAAARRRGVDAIEADFADLPFADASFPAAFAFQSIIHVPHRELPGVMAEVRRVLADGALFLAVVWGGDRHSGPIEHEWLHPPRYFSFYPDDEIRSFEFPGFAWVDFSIRTDTEDSDLRAQVLLLRAVSV